VWFLGITGVLTLLAAGWAYLGIQNDYTVCRSAFVAALATSDCDRVDTVHTASVAGLVAGIGMITGAIIVANRPAATGAVAAVRSVRQASGPASGRPVPAG